MNYRIASHQLSGDNVLNLLLLYMLNMCFYEFCKKSTLAGNSVDESCETKPTQ